MTIYFVDVRVSSLILLQSVPGHISLRDLRTRLLRDVEGVVAVHELHVWELSVLRAIATAHLHVRFKFPKKSFGGEEEP